jgi:hypothetical protein
LRALITLFVFSIFTYLQTYGQNIEWFTMGSGLSSTARTVVVLNNDVYVGGIFALAGGIQTNNIAKWDGNQWLSLAGGTNGEVDALAVIGNDIYAAGFFSMAGGVPVNNIAKWDGSNWLPLGEGVNSAI